MSNAKTIAVLRIRVAGFCVQDVSRQLTEQWGQSPVEWMAPTDSTVWLELYFAEAVEARLTQASLQLDARILATEIRMTSPAEWEAFFRSQFKPFTVGHRLRICPVWSQSDAPVEGRVTVWLDPGLSFGTGQHHGCAACRHKGLSRRRLLREN